MKRNILIIAFVLISTSVALAQNKYDALRFSQIYYEGTARSLAIGNALTAVGGDIGAISLNPAASAVYRHSEFSFTPSLNISSDKASYLGMNTNDSKTRFGISEAGIVGYFPTGRKYGLVSFTIGAAVNQTNNYNSRTNAHGLNNSTSWLGSLANQTNGVISTNMEMKPESPNQPFYNNVAPWKSILGWNSLLIDNFLTNDQYIGTTENYELLEDNTYNIYLGGPLNQSFSREISGTSSQFDINFAGNFSNKLFFGINIGFQSIGYYHYESYSEAATDRSDFMTKFDYFRYQYKQTSTGAGVNFKAGIIYLPFTGLRLGASISTPTWLHMRDEWVESMDTRHAALGGEDETYDITSPLGYYDYRINTPFRVNAGIAYTIGKFGLISVDYEFADYSKIKMMDGTGASTGFYNENSSIRTSFKGVNNLRAGLEVKVLPSLAIRGGYNYYESPEKGYNGETHFASIGAGFSFNSGLFIDAAFQKQLNNLSETYSLYQDYGGLIAPPMKNDYTGCKVLLSLGYRF